VWSVENRGPNDSPRSFSARSVVDKKGFSSHSPIEVHLREWRSQPSAAASPRRRNSGCRLTEGAGGDGGEQDTHPRGHIVYLCSDPEGGVSVDGGRKALPLSFRHHCPGPSGVPRFTATTIRG